jgi:hypothetical protein
MDPKEPVQICGMEGDFICQMSQINTETHANARAIAALPELIESLQGLFAYCATRHLYCEPGWVTKCHDRALAALAKAGVE